MNLIKYLFRHGFSLVFFSPFTPLLTHAFSNENQLDGNRFFETKVRPTISANCKSCHEGEDAANGFRLDSAIHFKTNPQTRINLILKVIEVKKNNHANGYHSLEKSQYSVLSTWVQTGAHWPDYSRNKKRSSKDKISHWAFQPIRSVSPPDVNNAEWNTHPIDKFIFRKLSTKGMTPSEKAEPSTLIRRLYLTLTGLHPSPKELQTSLANWNKNKLESITNYLLSQPAYGEKWARHWLDVARYSDAKGYVDAGEIKYPFAYTYRDYVINAFNFDLPFNKFIREQIAADKFVKSNSAPSLAALGFLTVGHRFNFFYDEIIDDRIDVVTRGFLGLSASCARCHDHKFDPISTADYYSLFGVFKNSFEPTPDLLPILNPHRIDTQQKEAKEKAKNYHEFRNKLHNQISVALSKWSGDYLNYIVQTSPEHRTKPQPEHITERGLIRVKSAYSDGGVVRWQKFLNSINKNHRIFGLWYRAWNLPKNKFEESINGIIEELSHTDWHNRHIIEIASKWPGGIKNMAMVSKVYGQAFQTAFEKSEAQSPINSEGFLTGDPGMDQILKFFKGPSSPSLVSIDESEDIYLLDESSSSRRNFAEIERAYLEKWEDSSPRAMVMLDRPETEKTSQFIYKRGDRHLEGKTVPPIIPKWISGTKPYNINQGSGRKELALAISHPQNPLTARVIVNRVWEWHFGQGLVKTPSDFGMQSEAPSHPGLLDYLARWFIQNDWSLKRLHKFIIASNAWQQSSKISTTNQNVDPDNRFIWRRKIQRLDFETMRDSILKLSGLLDLKMGGIPVIKPPDHLNNNRRTVYSFVDRENLADVFMTFDFPSPDISAPRRSDTTVPQQTLFLLNSPFMLHHSQSIVERSLSQDLPNLQSILSDIYRRILLRQPDTDELKLLLKYFTDYDDFKASLYDKRFRDLLIEITQALLLSNEFQFME